MRRPAPALFLPSAAALILLLGALLAPAQNGGAIPDRPEKLSFPPLQYEPPNPSDYRVPLKAGPVAYIVPDRTLPLVSLTLYVRTGTYVVPEGKEGLAELTGYLLARSGTESRTAEELEERLAFLAAILNSGIGDTLGTVQLNLLAKDLDEGLGILREVLTRPRFQENKIGLRKQQMLQVMKQRNDDSAAIEARERAFLAYGERFFVNRHSTAASLEGLSREDLSAFHRKWFHPENFVVAASGDFEREDMIRRLEALFSNWPFRGERPPAIPDSPRIAEPGIYLVEKDVPQGRVSVLLPGIRRDHPDYFSILVMNDILGGGGFTSRIMNRVRSDEGLAYSAGSSFPGGIWYPLTFTAGFQSKSRTVPYALSIVLQEMRAIAEKPVSEEEIQTAKKSFIDSFPQNFVTRSQVAATFAMDEFTGRYQKDPGFWKEYRARVEKVGIQEVQRAARDHLRQEKLVVLIVGQKEEILKGHPDYPVQLKELGNGKIISVPLRDPLTLKPINN